MQDARRGLLVMGIAMAVVGTFGPWIPHQTAALAVTGSEIAWLAKFFGQSMRELYALPLIVGGMLLGLVFQRVAVRPLVRLGVMGLSVLLILASLPLYDSILGPEYRRQLILTVVSVGLAPLTLLAPRLDRRLWGGLIVLLSLVGIVPAVWQFAAFHPRVATLYDAALGIGWGLVVCAVGFILLLVYGVLAILKPA